MKYAKLLGLMLVAAMLATLAIGVAKSEQTKKEQIILWGKQTKGWGHSVNAKTDGNKVTLDQTAKIVKVEGTAKSYCIWSGGRSVLCGGEKRQDIVGKTLGKGTYSVLPGLSDGQSEAKVTIYLEYP